MRNGVYKGDALRLNPILTLPITRKWFDMILSGEKTEEYREMTPYYDARLKRYSGQSIAVRFRNGYRRNSPAIVCNVIVCQNREGREEWGAEPNRRYYALKIKHTELEVAV